MTDINCGNCLYWYRCGETQEGTCHRKSPVVHDPHDEQGDIMINTTAWPTTNERDWCGDWDPMFFNRFGNDKKEEHIVRGFRRE